MNEDDINKIFEACRLPETGLSYNDAFRAFDDGQLRYYSDLDQAAFHAIDAVLLASGEIEQRWYSVESEKQDAAYQKIKDILKAYAEKANQPHPPTTPDANKEA